MDAPSSQAKIHWPGAGAVGSTSSRTSVNALPPLLQTPGGLALLELQGAFNLPATATAMAADDDDGDVEKDDEPASHITPIGRLQFPDYDPAAPESTAWMRRVQLYVGPHQRLTGEVKKLPRPLAVLRRQKESPDGDNGDNNQLEVVELIHYKLLFSQRPEPMTGTAAAEAAADTEAATTTATPSLEN
ncbi:Chromosome transmission fidelity protein 8 [Niveomyces insectorum RCEF 264]|uniref:Chromosome transmission fidelity protein 8 n=1 Tax=Niveomyces insectorum RCEF 264 TaxID=1081102 RepID=A0A167QSG3_9HYPO|nr:Chromosome transmission fidelity protein 8 [Niveomyces insectorum RCEF 264]